MRALLLAALAAASPSSWAQSAPQTVIVTGNPLGSGETATPASALGGNALALRRAATLAETLDGLPGVAATWFGPNANRPVIRGQDGDRIRLLSNAGASLDASGLSFDHAVPLEPLVIERIEVLRGPAALLYGGGAIGGVVNALDNRIPKSPLAEVAGAVETRLGGAAQERAVSALLEGGAQGLSWHADAFARRSGDLRVPAFEPPVEDGGGGSDTRRRVVNSASRAEGGALGVSRAWRDGHAGVSIETFGQVYGVVAEDDITIRMRRERLAAAGEVRALAGWVSTVRGHVAATDYRHEEVESGGVIGTTFATRGTDARLEAVLAPTRVAGGRLDTSVGLQAESARFSALGQEAFVPSTHTRQTAAFVLARWSWAAGSHASVGLRGEQVQVRSEGDAAGEAARFGLADTRRFTPRSASLSVVWAAAPAWQLSASAAATERAPTSYELYANGLHAATGTFERGDPQQTLERGRNLDLALAWRNGSRQLKLSAFASRFARYIALSPTGEPDFIDDAGQAHPVYAFRGVRARLQGFEVEAQWPLLDGPRPVVLDARADAVRGVEEPTGAPLPRLAPRRLSVGLSAHLGAWQARLEARHAWAQRRVPADDTPTAGWTVLDLGASREFQFMGHASLLIVKLGNLGHTLAYSATTIATVRPLAPLPGRSLSVSWRVGF
ncbi:MAG: TonB-dependent receptor [Rubrivivax sp.]